MTRLTSRFGVATAVCCFLAIARLAFAAQNIILRVDPRTPEKAAAVWLYYLGARMVYHDKHKPSTPASGEIIPSLAEEAEARSTASAMYRVLKEKDAKLKDPYWEILSEVDHRGFMAAYAWTFLRRKQWPASDRPANLAAFEAWQKTALPNHKAQTYGWLEAGKS